MNQSLSVVLPVYNVEGTLARQVHDLLDFLPDLTAQFEVVIVDDGSTDHTEETAHELAREFPQLRVLHHGFRRGLSVGAATGVANAKGRFVYVQDEETPLNSTDLQRFWDSCPRVAEATEHDVANDDRVLPPGRMQNLQGTTISRLMAWGSEMKRKMPKEAPLAGVVQSARRKALGV